MRKVLGGNGQSTPDRLAPYAMAAYDFFTEDIKPILDSENTAVEKSMVIWFTFFKHTKLLDKAGDVAGAARDAGKAVDKGTVKDVTFKKGYDTHLTEVEGFKAKPNIGIKGGHNLENFEQLILDNFGNQVKDINQAVTKTPHPDISGIYEVKYKLPVYDGLSKENGGKGNFTGQWKEYKNPKTVYDPKVFSDEQILKLGREAMEEGISNNRIIQGGDRSPSNMVEGYVNVNGKRLEFMGFRYKNTGEISNFFPVLD
ncbi:CdiA family toxin C-terminal domain-containing protein [Lysinibacillus odysseyi]|nr:CdiA family toxin C-terminal domain-containing protein [Lysinibacillus odysseyi]